MPERNKAKWTVKCDIAFFHCTDRLQLCDKKMQPCKINIIKWGFYC